MVVNDFTVASDLVVIDHGFSTRLERKGGNYPILERRQRTAERVNDEIVATIVATLREAGLKRSRAARRGFPAATMCSSVSGRLRAADEGKGKGAQKYSSASVPAAAAWSPI